MKTNYYFLKLHYDILDDWKVGTLPDSLKWRFIQCLCVAGEQQEEGLLPELNQFAYRIRQEPNALKADMARLASNELVELVQLEDGSERWFITNYAKRQAKISNAQRQRDYRIRQRENITNPLPNNNEPVTNPLRHVTQNKNKNKNRVEGEEEYTYSAHAENNLQSLLDIAAKIACEVKTPYGPGINEDDFEKAAALLLKWQAVDAISGFADWWKQNGYYAGKPALKSFLSEYQNYLNGVQYEKGQSNAGPAEQALIEYEQIKREFFNATSAANDGESSNVIPGMA